MNIPKRVLLLSAVALYAVSLTACVVAPPHYSYARPVYASPPPVVYAQPAYPRPPVVRFGLQYEPYYGGYHYENRMRRRGWH